MTAKPSGHIEELPSGSFRVSVYAGTDLLTGRSLRHRETAKTMSQAQIVLGRLLEAAEAGRRPDSRVLVKDLLTRYLEVAELEPAADRRHRVLRIVAVRDCAGRRRPESCRADWPGIWRPR